VSKEQKICWISNIRKYEVKNLNSCPDVARHSNTNEVRNRKIEEKNNTQFKQTTILASSQRLQGTKAIPPERITWITFQGSNTRFRNSPRLADLLPSTAEDTGDENQGTATPSPNSRPLGSHPHMPAPPSLRPPVTGTPAHAQGATGRTSGSPALSTDAWRWTTWGAGRPLSPAERLTGHRPQLTVLRV